jgi:hypothetical protein
MYRDVCFICVNNTDTDTDVDTDVQERLNMGQIGLLVRQVSEPHAILTKPNHNTPEF